MEMKPSVTGSISDDAWNAIRETLVARAQDAFDDGYASKARSMSQAIGMEITLNGQDWIKSIGLSHLRDCAPELFGASGLLTELIGGLAAADNLVKESSMG